MKNGFEIIWTDNALSELKLTLEYLEQNFSDKELKKLAGKIELVLKLILENSLLFPKSEFKNTHRAVILKFNTMYYRIRKDETHILSFFSNRKDLSSRKM